MDAARDEFAELGFDGASVRSIAARAEVNPALLHHYFGTKEQLFTAAVALPFEPQDVATAIASAPQDSKGEHLARQFFAVWEDPARRAPVLALLRSAMAHETAARLIRQFARRALVSRIAPAVHGPHAELRVEAAVSHMMGLAIGRYVLKVEPLASTPVDELIALVAPVVQRYFDGDSPPRRLN